MSTSRIQAIINQSGGKKAVEPHGNGVANQIQADFALERDETIDSSGQDEIETVRKQYEDRIRAQREQYQRVIKELDAFSYSVAHDLRAPLRAVALLVDRLTEQQNDHPKPESAHTISAIKDSTVRMQNLVESLLKFSKTNGLQQDLIEVDMTALARSVLDELLQSESGASLTVFVEPLHSVVADIALIRQVWVNLLSNALKYTRKKSARQIRISSRASVDEVTYSIADNGTGFNMKYADKLFGVFQRLHSSDEFEGTGVGLAIVQRIIHKHGGRVWAEGIEDKGATFHFALPVSQVSARPTRN